MNKHKADQMLLRRFRVQVRLSPRHLHMFASHVTPALVEVAVFWQSKAAVEGWNLLPLSSLCSADLRNKREEDPVSDLIHHAPLPHTEPLAPCWSWWMRSVGPWIFIFSSFTPHRVEQDRLSLKTEWSCIPAWTRWHSLKYSHYHMN